MSKTEKSPRIMVVDDDEGLLILMAEAFRNEGCEVMTANSGTAALNALGRRKPDLMLLDLKMQDVGGPALIERMKEEGLLVPFVVVTGQGDERVAVEVMKQGALDYVMKDNGLLDRLPLVVRRALNTLEKNRALALAEADRRRLEREILEISEREQQRIGEDLHDGLGQQLTAIELLCAGLKADVGSRPKLAKQVERIGKSIREAVKFVRHVARGLAPQSDALDALPTSLLALAELTNSLGAAKCRFEGPEHLELDDHTKAVPLYRIAQEAVNNAIKHSGASEVVIRLVQNEDALKLQISDNGDGIRKSKGNGMGLQVMQHRAGGIGAELTVEFKPGEGVTVVCLLPRANETPPKREADA